MANVKIIVAVILLLLVLVVVFQNAASVETKVLFLTVKMPRALLLVVMFSVGFTAGIFVADSLASRPRRPGRRN